MKGIRMTIEQIQRAARQVGLRVEPQQLGYRLLDSRGRIMASQLPKDHIEALVKCAVDARALEARIALRTPFFIEIGSRHPPNWLDKERRNTFPKPSVEKLKGGNA
jgi:hypothetical protein